MSQVTDAAHEARNSETLERAVRFGLACYGLVYLVIAWLGVQLAFGDKQGSVSKNGALRQLTDQPLGRSLLWVLAVGFVALVVWQVLELLLGTSETGASKAMELASHVVKAIVFGALAVSTTKVALGSGGSQGDATRTWTARLMDQPFGPWLVGAAGLAVIAYGVVSARKAFTDSYEKHLDLEGLPEGPEQALRWAARSGYVARGAAFAVIGGLLVWAAATHDPKKSGGLDVALNRVLHAPAGPALLVAVSLGLACFGVFCFGWAARFRR